MGAPIDKIRQKVTINAGESSFWDVFIHKNGIKDAQVFMRNCNGRIVQSPRKSRKSKIWKQNCESAKAFSKEKDVRNYGKKSSNLKTT